MHRAASVASGVVGKRAVRQNLFAAAVDLDRPTCVSCGVFNESAVGQSPVLTTVNVDSTTEAVGGIIPFD
jgi:hypothetical protein